MNLDLPSLQMIGKQAFRDCSSLTEVTLGPSLVGTARDAFEGCSSLTKLQCTYRTGVLLPWAVTHVVVQAGTTHIHNSAFAACDALRDLSGVTRKTPTLTFTLGDSCFWGCTALSTEMLWGLWNSCTAVGVGAFARCDAAFISSASESGIHERLPSHATQDSYTFMGDNETVPNTVSHVVIHESVTHIYPGLFAECEFLETLEIRSPTSFRIYGASFGNLVYISPLTNVRFASACRVTLDRDAFQCCPDLVCIFMPDAFYWVLEGGYVEHGPHTNDERLPIMRDDNDRRVCQPLIGCAHTVVTEFARYQLLQIVWDWLLTPNCTAGLTICAKGRPATRQQQRKEDRGIALLGNLFALRPPPPQDIVDAALNYSRSHYFSIFCRFPSDVIRNILEHVG